MPFLPPDFEPTVPDPDLPELPFWQARSFWLTLFAVLAPVVAALGLDWPWVSSPATVDLIMQVVGAVAAGLAWRERIAPAFRLVLK